ncbi:MAG: phosphodiesterase [Planctomycetales bacterium]
MTCRVVQLTDCHLFADPQEALRGVVTWPRFVAALVDIRRRVPDCQWLIITGDLTHDESRAAYQAVRRELGDWVDRVRVIPGNHDDRPLLGELFPQGDTGPEGRQTFAVSASGWQLIGLDAQIPGKLPGELGEAQRSWLQGQLERSPRPTLLFVHHPPIPVGSPWLDVIGLQDARELGELLRRFPQVRLVACGHVHQELAGSLGSATVLTTPAVGPQFRPRTAALEIDPAPPAYRVLELHSTGEWSTQVLRFREC